MSCVTFGSERNDPDWTQAELELLEAELTAARKKFQLEMAKYYGVSIETAQSYIDRSQISITHQAQLQRTVKEVYEKAHDRHFFDMLKRAVNRRAAHAHQPRK